MDMNELRKLSGIEQINESDIQLNEASISIDDVKSLVAWAKKREGKKIYVELDHSEVKAMEFSGKVSSEYNEKVGWFNFSVDSGSAKFILAGYTKKTKVKINFSNNGNLQLIFSDSTWSFFQ